MSEPRKTRHVVVELRVPMVVEVGADMPPDRINFWRHGNPGCASGWEGDLDAMFERWQAEEDACEAAHQAGDDTARERHPPCPCDVLRHRYVREATSDEARLGFTTDGSITEELDYERLDPAFERFSRRGILDALASAAAPLQALRERFLAAFGRNVYGVAAYAAFLAAPGDDEAHGTLCGFALSEARLVAMVDALDEAASWLGRGGAR